MIATDHHRRADLAGGDHLVEPHPGQVPLARAEPADPRRKTLEGDLSGARRIQRCRLSLSGNSSRTARSVA